jgi:hypothetical protein
VPVELLRLLVPGPDVVLDGGKDGLDPGRVRFVRPDVVITVGRVAIAARLLEPPVLVRGVLGDEVDDNSDTEIIGLLEQPGEVGDVTEATERWSMTS